MLTCLKRFKATNVHFMLKTSLEGRARVFTLDILHHSVIRIRDCIIRIPMFRIICSIRFSKNFRDRKREIIVAVVFRGQKDRDQRSRPTRNFTITKGIDFTELDARANFPYEDLSSGFDLGNFSAKLLRCCRKKKKKKERNRLLFCFVADRRNCVAPAFAIAQREIPSSVFRRITNEDIAFKGTIYYPD